MRFSVLTLFPEMMEGAINSSILKRAQEQGLIQIDLINFREFATNKHQQVDDYAYGGGAGMLIGVEPVHRALKSIAGYQQAKKLLTSPSGLLFNQAKCEQLKNEEHIIIVCGHYEGIDARVLNYVDEEISIGDYVLTGGEIPALVIIEAVSRLVTGVINNASLQSESHAGGLLEYPQYTRPAVYDGVGVPEVLISGHHENIRKWQRKEALKKTLALRPELLAQAVLTPEEQCILAELKK